MPLAPRLSAVPQLSQPQLAAGERPIYVGFGSAVVQDPAATSRTIFGALEKAGARGIVSRGWANLGGEAPPTQVYLIDDCPHDWLFPRCRAVCHHGGAGTTAAGLRAGLPTVVVPFFGDQFFLGPGGLRRRRRARANSDRHAEQRAAGGSVRGLRSARDENARGRTGRQNPHRGWSGARIRIAAPAFADPRHAMRTRSGAPGDDLLRAVSPPPRQPCFDEHHRGHASHPYRYVDWGVRAPEHLGKELWDLIADAAEALRAGRDELRPTAAPHRHGVVLNDTDAPADGASEPVRRR